MIFHRLLVLIEAECLEIDIWNLLSCPKTLFLAERTEFCYEIKAHKIMKLRCLFVQNPAQEKSVSPLLVQMILNVLRLCI